MSKKRKYIVIAGATSIVLLSGIFFVKNNFAQNLTNSQSIEISPPSQELNVDPGQRITLKAIVRNKSDQAYDVKTRIEDFTASGDEGQVALVSEGPWAISQWSTVTPSTFVLEPNSQKEVEVDVRVPEQNIGGGRYGAIVFSVSDEPGENEASVAQEIASLFLLRVSGPIEERINVLEFTAPPFVEFGPVPFSLKFQNSGNVHVKTSGIISVMNVLGKKVDDIVITPTNVFPQSSRIVDVDLDRTFLIGPYQAIGIIYYGSNNESITVYTPFFAFPVKIVAAILILVFVAFFLRKRMKKKR